MHRFGVIMTYLVAASAGLAVVIVIAFPGETAWLMLAMVPPVLLGVVLVHASMPDEEHASIPPARVPYWPRAANPPYHEGSWGPDADARSLAGTWRGTLKLRSKANASVTLLPLGVFLNGEPPRVRLLASETGRQSLHVATLDLVECDPIRSHVYLCVGLAEWGRRPHVTLTTRLVHHADALLPDDPSGDAVIELRRT